MADGFKGAVDGLGHDKLAAAIVEHLDTLPDGSVVAIQAPWGRGKTDLLQRVRGLCEERDGETPSARPLWVNPWEYGTPNLIAPLVIELLERLPPAQRSERVKQAARTLLRAGNAVAFKALSVFVPFGEVLSGGQQPVDDLIKQLFEPGADTGPTDADPVAAMAGRFRDLIDDFLAATESPGPMIVCVDDLDRCLPDRQIAMLEAMHFLTSAGARAVFVIAIDPRLVQQAAVSHYSGSGFDVEQYLNKLFDLRVTLTALAGDLRQRFVTFVLGAGDLAGRLGIDREELADIWNRTFYLPELSNPRLMSRALRRLDLYLAADPNPLDLPVSDEESEIATVDRVAVLIRLIAIAERWPDLRFLMQALDPVGLPQAFKEFTAFYGVTSDSTPAEEMARLKDRFAEAGWVFERLPNRKSHPDLGLFLSSTLLIPDVTTALLGFDAKLMAVGL